MPVSAFASTESSALTASAPTTAPHSDVAPPMTSIASVMNVRSRYTPSIWSGRKCTYRPPASPARNPESAKAAGRKRPIKVQVSEPGAVRKEGGGAGGEELPEDVAALLDAFSEPAVGDAPREDSEAEETARALVIGPPAGFQDQAIAA